MNNFKVGDKVGPIAWKQCTQQPAYTVAELHPMHAGHVRLVELGDIFYAARLFELVISPTPAAWVETMATTKVVCTHKWKFYIGVLDKYEFCEHCDVKRSV